MGWIKNRIEAEFRKHKDLNWSGFAEAKIRANIIQLIREHPRKITEAELNKMENIELSYTGEMIPVEVIEEICSSE